MNMGAVMGMFTKVIAMFTIILLQVLTIVDTTLHSTLPLPMISTEN
jgi:hypothetical protein